MSSSSFLGDLFLLRSGYSPFFLLYASRRLPSVICASSGGVFCKRKCVQALNLVFSLWLSSRERIEVSLLPMYKTLSPSALPISYTPGSFSSNALISLILKGFHLDLIGISYYPIAFCQFYTMFGNNSNGRRS